MVKTLEGKYYYLAIVLWLTWAMLSAGAGKNLHNGWKYFVMTTDSMAPGIPPKAVVIVKQKPEYEVGEVISFYAKVAEKELIVAHRIAALGGNTYITAGDQNQAWDAVPVVPRLVIGKVETTIPFLGWVILAMTNKSWRLLTVVMPIVLVIINELLKIIKELKNEPADRH